MIPMQLMIGQLTGEYDVQKAVIYIVNSSTATKTRLLSVE